MKKTTGKKLALNKDTLKSISSQELRQVNGGASGTYCADCGSGTACPQIRFYLR